jgi:hypothetical protein
MPINFVNQFKQAQEIRSAADKKLIDNMEACADWLVKFRTHLGHFPFVGPEEDKAIAYLQKKLLKPNPYTITAVASTEEKKAVCPIKFVHDIGLTDAQRETWETKPPQDWRAEPGSITIIVNEYDNLVIWGSGADRNPVIDAKTNKYYLSWRAFR